jgi:hypothetical protein
VTRVDGSSTGPARRRKAPSTTRAVRRQRGNDGSDGVRVMVLVEPHGAIRGGHGTAIGSSPGAVITPRRDHG